ncbi:hypothetical protein NP233_g4953 [Leucocoprinus birnbaumii]|uniref:Mid2 domain-containing protein n=1 Tax=Leucocoprinus birnbaumii TaxID=56174 RepID=A0AAD5YV14_9AGAR|nr:hypothetical protein NP233_g4953 [Leucocoprinus birnbaumii]
MDGASIKLNWFGTAIELIGNVTADSSISLILDGREIHTQPDNSLNLLASVGGLSNTDHDIELVAKIPTNSTKPSMVVFDEAVITYSPLASSSLQNSFTETSVNNTDVNLSKGWAVSERASILAPNTDIFTSTNAGGEASLRFSASPRPPTSNDSSDSNARGRPKLMGGIAGGITGGCVVLICLLLLFRWSSRRRRREGPPNLIPFTSDTPAAQTSPRETIHITARIVNMVSRSKNTVRSNIQAIREDSNHRGRSGSERFSIDAGPVGVVEEDGSDSDRVLPPQYDQVFREIVEETREGGAPNASVADGVEI